MDRRRVDGLQATADRIAEVADATVRRARERGRESVVRTLRLTAAAVLAYLASEALTLSGDPLVAALTALIVVQVTLSSTALNALQRVSSVVAGVAVAVAFSSTVGLTWWSLGLLVAASIVVGQVLRLGPQLIEVPISAMLVLAVGGAGWAATGRVLETLVGAAVGLLMNVLLPPAVRTRDAGAAVERFATDLAALLDTAAGRTATGITLDEAQRWLDDARRLNRHVPDVDRALRDAEESRRLNPRALATVGADAPVRVGLDALEHSSVAVRTLFRSVADAARGRVQEDPGYLQAVRRTTSVLLADAAEAVRRFGAVVRAESALPATGATRRATGATRRAASDGPPAVDEEAALAAALVALRRDRADATEVLFTDPREHPALWEMNGALLATIDRLIVELDLAEHARRRDERLAQLLARRASVKAAERFRTTTRQLGELPRQVRDRAGAPCGRSRTTGAAAGPGRPDSDAEHPERDAAADRVRFVVAGTRLGLPLRRICALLDVRGRGRLSHSPRRAARRRTPAARHEPWRVRDLRHRPRRRPGLRPIRAESLQTDQYRPQSEQLLLYAYESPWHSGRSSLRSEPPALQDREHVPWTRWRAMSAATTRHRPRLEVGHRAFLT